MTPNPARPPARRPVARALLAGLLGIWLLGACEPAPATTSGTPAQPAGISASRDPFSGLPWITAAELPREGQATLKLIARGGPFPYARDGATFGNRERLLPAQPRGHYREYTVPTPGESDRGARRIVCGGPPRAACYYTADHYASFRRIRP